MNTQLNDQTPENNILKYDQQIDKYEQMNYMLKITQEQCKKKIKELKKQREIAYKNQNKDQNQDQDQKTTNYQPNQQNSIIPINSPEQTNYEQTSSFLNEINALTPTNNLPEKPVKNFFLWDAPPEEEKIELIIPNKKKINQPTNQEDYEDVIEVEFDDNNNIKQITDLSKEDDKTKKAKYNWFKATLIEMVTTRDVSYYINDQTAKKNRNIAYLSLQEVKQLHKIEKNNQREHPALNEFLQQNATQKNEYTQNQYTQNQYTKNEYAQTPYTNQTSQSNIKQTPIKTYRPKSQKNYTQSQTQ